MDEWHALKKSYKMLLIYFPSRVTQIIELFWWIDKKKKKRRRKKKKRRRKKKKESSNPVKRRKTNVSESKRYCTYPNNDRKGENDFRFRARFWGHSL